MFYRTLAAVEALPLFVNAAVAGATVHGHDRGPGHGRGRGHGLLVVAIGCGQWW